MSVDHDLSLAQLSPETQAAISAALGTWAGPLRDFYDALTVGQRMPPDVASQLVVAFFETTLAASYAQPEYDD